MLKNRKLIEGIDETGAPDEKYYAFDWDDNIVTMPTKIILKDDEGREVGMSTEDFADYNHPVDLARIAVLTCYFNGITCY